MTLPYLAFHTSLWKNNPSSLRCPTPDLPSPPPRPPQMHTTLVTIQLYSYIDIVFFFLVGAAGGGSLGLLLSANVSRYCLFMAISVDHGCIIMPWIHNRLLFRVGVRVRLRNRPMIGQSFHRTIWEWNNEFLCLVDLSNILECYYLINSILT